MQVPDEVIQAAITIEKFVSRNHSDKLKRALENLHEQAHYACAALKMLESIGHFYPGMNDLRSSISASEAILKP